jgi:hypothetical protein
MTAAKMWVAGFGTLITALTAALSDDVFDIADGTQIGITVVTIIGTMVGVWATRNQGTANPL